jgi:DNA-directed RNA polymerase specialized sigma54-like protein
VLVPDVFVRAAPDGSWLVELNSEALPRVLVNHSDRKALSVSVCGPRVTVA